MDAVGDISTIELQTDPRIGDVAPADQKPNEVDETREKTDQVATSLLLREGEKILPSKERQVTLNPARAIVDVVLLNERFQIKKLNENEEKSKNRLDTTDQLLKLNSELMALSVQVSSLSDDSKVELSDAVKAILEDLKGKGIDLLKTNPSEISKSQLMELKGAISSYKEKCRIEVQQVFTKMNSLIQDMSSVNETGRRVISDFIQLLRTISRNSVVH